MIRIILFIDIDCDKIRTVGHLRNGVDYKTVVAFSVIRGHDIKSVTYAEKRRQIVFVCAVSRTCDIIAAKFLDKTVKRVTAVRVECGTSSFTPIAFFLCLSY